MREADVEQRQTASEQRFSEQSEACLAGRTTSEQNGGLCVRMFEISMHA